MRKLVILHPPAGWPPLSADELGAFHRRLAELEERHESVQVISLPEGWSYEVVEGDEVQVRLAEEVRG